MVRFGVFAAAVYGALCVALAGHALPEVVLQPARDGTPAVLDVRKAEGENLALFRHQNALWLVSDTVVPEPQIPRSLWPALQLDAVEKLVVEQGAGYRLAFQSYPEKMSLFINGKAPEKRLLPSQGAILLHDRVMVEDAHTAQVLRAESPQTREHFRVAVSPVARHHQAKAFGQLRFPESHIGVAFYDDGAGVQEARLENGYLTVFLPVAETRAAVVPEPVVSPAVAAVGADELEAEALAPETPAVHPKEKDEALTKNPLAEADISPEEKTASTPEQTVLAEREDAAPSADKSWYVFDDNMEYERVSAPEEHEDETVVFPPLMLERKGGGGTASYDEAMGRVAEAISRIRALPQPEGRRLSHMLYEMGLGGTPADPVAEDLRQSTLDMVSDALRLGENESLFAETDEPINSYNAWKRRMLRAIVEAPNDKARDQLRMELARASVAFKRIPEAADMLRAMPIFDNGQPRSPEARIMLGALYSLMGRYRDAETLLSIPGGPEKERRLWSAFNHQKQGKDADAIPLFRESIDASEAYPHFLQRILRLTFAQALLNKEQVSLMQEQLDTLAAVLDDEAYPDDANLMIARAALLRGDYVLAENLLAQVANAKDKQLATEAQFTYLMMLLARGDVTAEQAIAALDELRFMWRGDKVERDILYELSKLLAQEGRYREALERMKAFTTYFPREARAPEIAARMVRVFEDLLSKPASETGLEPIAILALYYDFRELTPPGREGDLLITKVARRMMELGLNERALRLLENQYQYRAFADAARRAGIATDIAQIYFEDGRYEDALSLLEDTDPDITMPEMQVARRLLRAEIYRAQGKTAEAIAVLQKVKEHNDVLNFLAEIAWNENKSEQFISLIEPLFVKGSPFDDWSDIERRNFMRLALAYNQLGQIRNLEGLRNKYINKIVNPDDQRYFELLLKDKGSAIVLAEKPGERSVLDRVVQEMENYNEFAKSYGLVKRKRDSEKRQRYLYNRARDQLTAPPTL